MKYTRIKKKYIYDGDIVEDVEITLKSEKKIVMIKNATGIDVTEQWSLSPDSLSASKVYEINVDTFLYVEFENILEQDIVDIRITKIGTNYVEPYAFDRGKNKHSVFVKNDFAFLKSEHVFLPNEKYIQFNFFFPNSSWTAENTKIVSARSIYYTSVSNGYEMGQIRQLPTSVVVLGANEEPLKVWENYSILVNPYGYSSLFEEADITVEYARNTKPTAGHKLVVELVLMKIDSEVANCD